MGTRGGPHRREVGRGGEPNGIDNSAAHPREVFKPATVHSVAGIVLAHNHPSGDPEPGIEILDAWWAADASNRIARAARGEGGIPCGWGWAPFNPIARPVDRAGETIARRIHRRR